MKNLKLRFSDREYNNLRNIRQRLIRAKFYKLFRWLAKLISLELLNLKPKKNTAVFVIKKN